MSLFNMIGKDLLIPSLLPVKRIDYLFQYTEVLMISYRHVHFIALLHKKPFASNTYAAVAYPILLLYL
jgi:hypothetical protein